MSRGVVASGVIASPGLADLLLVSNFVGGETKIERRIELLHALDGPRFMRERGVPLEPSFLHVRRLKRC